MFDEILSAYGNKLTIAVLGVGLALILLLAVLWLIRGRGGPSPFVRGGKSRQPRLQVLDAAAVDARRRLVLVRRDNVEHLIMIGGPTDIVIESGIGDDRHLTALEGSIARDRTAINPAQADAQISADLSAPMISPARDDSGRAGEAERPIAAARPSQRPAEPIPATAKPQIEASEPPARAQPRPPQTPPPIVARPQAAEPLASAVARPVPVSVPAPSAANSSIPLAAVEVAPVPESPATRPAPLVSQAPVSTIASAISAAPAVRPVPPQPPETPPTEPFLVEAGNMLDAARQRVMPPQQRQPPASQNPGVDLADFVPKVAAATAPSPASPPPYQTPSSSHAPVPAPVPQAAAPSRPKELGSDFERILETEMARNLQSGELPDDLMERLAPQPPAERREPGAPPAPSANADPAMQNEIARIFGEMSVTRDK